MTYLYILLTLVVLFVVWCAIGAASKIRASNAVATSLKPDAAAQFLYWDSESNKASAMGRDREARVCKAKSLVVAATNCPISNTVNGGVPLACQPGHLDHLPDSELDDLIASLTEAILKKETAAEGEVRS
jgi:hypothetical protein